MNIKTRPVTFRVVAVSDNANSFGLHGHVLMAQNGLTFEAARSRGTWNKELNRGDEIVLQERVNEDGSTIDRATRTDLFNWASNSFEIPRQLPTPPANVLKIVWG